MKKLMILLITAIGFNAAYAQSWSNNNDKPQRYNERGASNDIAYNNQHDAKEYGYNNDKGHYGYDKRDDSYNHIDRRYDERNKGYDNERFDRNRRQEPRYREYPATGGFGKGIVAGVLLGVLLSH